MSRPTIIVDLDNVVYSWAGAMALWLAKNGALERYALQGPPAAVAMKNYSKWAVWEDWGIPKGEFIRWWRLGIEAGEIYAKGPIIPGARNALWRLSDDEWDIHIATSRLTKFGLHDRIVENTAQWLRDNNIPYRQLSFTHAKHMIMADAIVDDRLDNMNELSHKRIFHFGANHNDSDITWPMVVKELESEYAGL